MPCRHDAAPDNGASLPTTSFQMKGARYGCPALVLHLMMATPFDIIILTSLAGILRLSLQQQKRARSCVKLLR